ncbi:hypothetical protein BSP109_02138 [Brevibacterium sp. Mu109]|uniref:hypothetical protein n=1 Tax=Brevibacterium sp. Mu109 TaxID=1255669 RepID=UPI000C61552B|nr:hypothetical protein [Brevibacterium sp. Mu109]MDN5896770.1 hypothetical protein [Nocardioides sp.]SMX86684.1 hypothetical protein BSP109_02138 [Brevibacterium sp. Mu109]
MSETVEAIVLAVFIVATSVWVGGYVAIVVVARTTTATLDAGARVAFFRSLGGSYLWVGFPALIVALVTGGVLARDQDWDGLLVVTVVVAALLLVSFAGAVAQARRMSRLRRRLLASPTDTELSEQVRRGARAAGILRAALGLLSLGLVVLGAFLAT